LGGGWGVGKGDFADDDRHWGYGAATEAAVRRSTNIANDGNRRFWRHFACGTCS
jgi:hypothetical protein